VSASSVNMEFFRATASEKNPLIAVVFPTIHAEA
jgi:hypothetical protein